jgi:putative membrane-bound dehydrogenase-like protein
MAALLVTGLLTFAASPPAKTQVVALNGHNFTLPVGFTIEVVANAPLVRRPITADFDEQGRLYVADSSGSNAKVAEQLKERPHRIVRLEDTDGDGVFDRQTVFADKMMFPEGTLWHDGSLYVAAPPSIWKLTDRDGDGVAEERVEWFQGKTLTGCANDLHGPYLGLDGRIYWAKGAFAQQRYKRAGKTDFVTRAAHLFRAKVEGTCIEPVMTGGMDNPVDVAFMPTGERIFTTTFFQHPGGGRRDGLVHAIYGGVYGKDHSPVYEHPWTGPTLMPVLAHFGPAAPAGLTRYESGVFGPEYRDNLFAVQFNLRKVSRHVLTPEGATYTSRDEDFLVSDNSDFHPTDVLEDADGSLLVVDTGGWYKLCCPSSQLVKADVLGAIYRVRRVGAPKIDDPRGGKIEWAKMDGTRLTTLLADPRPAVVHRAIHLLGKLGAAAVPALLTCLRTADFNVRGNAVWAATRIDHLDARAAVRLALIDKAEDVRQAALHSISLWRDREAMTEVKPLLKSKCAHVRRAAAEALGRLGDAKAVPALLAALTEPADRVLEHSLTYALIEIGDRDAVAKGLASDSPRVRRAALIALDQMPASKLDAAAVARELTATDPRLQEAAWWIAGRHPDWGGTLTRFFAARLADVALRAEQREELVAQLSRFAKGRAVQELLGRRLRESSSPEERILVLRAMAGAAVKPVPGEWVAGLTDAVATKDMKLLQAGLRAARVLPLTRGQSAKLVERLEAIANDERQPTEVRLGALAAMPGGVSPVKAETFALLRSKLDRDQPVPERALAVEVLLRAGLTREQHLALADLPKGIGPMELDRLLDVFAKTTDEAVGKKLLASLEASPVRSSLRVDGLTTRLAKYGPAVQKSLAVLCRKLDADLAAQREQLDALLGSLGKGDVRRGQAVFNSQKATCISCHAIGYVGGKIGPDLTRIGQIRSERDLLESIVFPSASFVRSYEPVQVTTTAGKTYNGLVRQETPEAVVLALTATEEVRLPRSEIEEMVPSKLSVMPAGMDKVLTKQELADLVSFLKACR